MTLRTKLLGPVAALAAVAVLAGCGGSSKPSKADFVKKADALCAQTNKAHPPKPRPRNAKEASAQQTEEIQIRTELDRKLRALEVPDDAKADFAAYNAGTQRIVAAIRKMKADANRGRERQYGKDSARFERQAAARERSAIRLGFKTCGRKNPVE